jgi:hypothetical protein
MTKPASGQNYVRILAVMQIILQVQITASERADNETSDPINWRTSFQTTFVTCQLRLILFARFLHYFHRSSARPCGFPPYEFIDMCT